MPVDLRFYGPGLGKATGLRPAGSLIKFCESDREQDHVPTEPGSPVAEPADRSPRARDQG